MRKFRGQKISKEKDFFTHDANFDHLSPSNNTFQVTLGDIPKDELLATAASIQDDTFVKLGLRNHTLRRRPIASRRVVSCTPEIQQTTTTTTQYTSLAPPAIPKRTSRLRNSFAPVDQQNKQRVVSMFEHHTVDEERFVAPQRVHTHKNKLSLEHDFNIGEHAKGHKSSDSLIAEIIEKYSEICYLNIDAAPEWVEDDEPVPDLVNCLSVSNSSIDTSSQFSFEQELDDNELIRRNSPSNTLLKTKPILNKPLPPIPVKKLSQSSYRNYDLKREKTISLDPKLLQTQTTRRPTSPQPAKENPYILTRTGGDSFKSVRQIEAVRQDEDDVAKFTRKCSTSSSRYSTSSEEQYTAPSTSNSSSFQLDEDMHTAPSSPQSSFYIKNPFSPKKIYKRNLTPINEKNGYEENKTTLCVVND